MAPKKMGVNSKSEEARGRKAAATAEKKTKDEKQKEDSFWKEAEGPSSKAAKKKEEAAMKKVEQAAKRAEKLAIEEKEAKEIEKYGKKVGQKASQIAGVPKVTAAELQKRREEEAKANEAKSEALRAKEKRMTEERDYENLVLQVNTNRIESLVDARTVDEALTQMTLTDAAPRDRHPEKRIKAAYKTFEDAELPTLKRDRPGMTLMQYKDLLWKMWKKSPANPLNQAQGSTS